MAKDRRSREIARIERAVTDLCPLEREVFLLSARDGLRNDEIALRLGIEIRDVERHLADALFQLDRHLRRGVRSGWKSW